LISAAALASCASFATIGSTADSVGPDTCPRVLIASRRSMIDSTSVPTASGKMKQTIAWHT
jgi:hypothetical protein